MGQRHSAHESRPLISLEQRQAKLTEQLEVASPERALLHCSTWTVAVVSLGDVPRVEEVQALANDQLLVSTDKSQLLLEVPLDPLADVRCCQLRNREGDMTSIAGHVAVDTHRQFVWSLRSPDVGAHRAVIYGVTPRYYEDFMCTTCTTAVSRHCLQYYTRMATSPRGDLYAYNAHTGHLECYRREDIYGVTMDFDLDSESTAKPVPGRPVSQLLADEQRVYALDAGTNVLWIWSVPGAKRPARALLALQLDVAQPDLSFGVTREGHILVYAPRLRQLDAYSVDGRHLGQLFSGLRLPGSGAPLLPDDSRLTVDRCLRLWLYSRRPLAPGCKMLLYHVNPSCADVRPTTFLGGDAPFPLKRMADYL